MKIIQRIKEIIIGKPLTNFSPKVKEHIALISIIAWIGLGADGLSSSAYGPEEAFLALGVYDHIAIYLTLATTFTVFLIAIAYNQVIELFPNGGGGYKVATHLLGARAGAISGSALIVDYILTIAVSVASGIDTLFSLLPIWLTEYKIEVEVLVIIVLMILNLRGMKESIKILMPLFLGFLITHVIIIVLGIFFHHEGLREVIPQALSETHKMSLNIGLLATLAIFLRAYSLGGGTYTGLEAVSTNVNMLAEPRVRTGRLTMLYMAISLSLTAGGILLLYLLWHVKPEYEKTLNAVVFAKIINEFGINNFWLGVILFFEAALLFVGANTGFLGCPTVMANMAVDKWMPRQLKELSNRLVTQNGVLFSGVIAILILLWAKGEVSTLVVLYSINVFLTFSLSLLGLCVYWIKSRKVKPQWKSKLLVSMVGFIVCAFILIITTMEKFLEGGWLTLLITTLIISVCFIIRMHYRNVGLKLNEVDNLFSHHFTYNDNNYQDLLDVNDKNQKTAVFFVTKHYGAGIHTLLWVQRLFPNTFKNFVFITSGEVDSESFANDEVFKVQYRKDLHHIIEKYRYFCTTNNLPSDGFFSYGVNEAEELIKLAESISENYSDIVFFGGKLVFIDENWWTRILHNNTTILLQRQLHLRGMQMVILPMKI